MDNTFLFPFEKIKKGAKILIYGAGEFGQLYLRQMLLTNYCLVVGFVDRNYKRYNLKKYHVYSPDEIKDVDFDYIVIAIKSKEGLPEIYRTLESNGVRDEKIVFIGKRRELDTIDYDFLSDDNLNVSLAFKKDGLSVAVLLLSAMGGLFFVKRFITALIEKFPECKIDIYAGLQIDAINCFYSDIKNINSVIPNLGTRFPYYENKYDLSLRVNSAGYLMLDFMDLSKIKSINPQYLVLLSELNRKIDEEKYNDTIPRIALFQDRKFHGQNCYTSYDYGLFDIHDKKILYFYQDQPPKFF